MNTPPLIDISPEQWEIVRRILQKHVPQYEVWAFGSRAKWTAKEFSDLDLAVITDKPLAIAVSASLSDDFSESDLPWKVDVVDWASTGEAFRGIIERDKVELKEADALNQINVGWRVVPLGEVITLQRGFDLPSQNRKPGTVPIVSSSGISDYHSEVGAKGPGVVTGRYGTIGQVFLIKEDYWPLNTTLWVKDFHGNDPFFASYLLRTIDFKSCSDKSSVPGVNRNDLHRIPVLLPPLPEQKAIAAILGSLDDKIELNRRMNATLEAMARALFQSWFVDFDPVRAKMDGLAPVGMDAETAALFPDSFEDSALGKIPRGWEIRLVGQVVDCVGGGTPSTTEPKYWSEGTHHWATPKDLSSLQAPVLLDTDRKLTSEGIAKISSGLLPTGTLLMSSRAPVGYLAITAMPVTINQGFIGLKCNEQASNFFLLNWCLKNMAEIETRATGTTFAEISKQNFRQISLTIPHIKIMEIYTYKVSPLYARITKNLYETRRLATIRDALLPKLLADELPVFNFKNLTFNAN
jgi:type I restriction enzyme, S subunit